MAGPSRSAPVSSAPYSRCSRSRSVAPCPPTVWQRAFGASSRRLARRRWCSSTSRTCGMLLDGNGAQIVTRGRGYELRPPRRRRSTPSASHGWSSRSAPGTRWPSGAEMRSPTSPTSRSPQPRSGGWSELRLRAAEMAIEADLAAGRHAAVIAELEALIAQHPLRERLHAQRMLALYRSGRQSEALEAYRNGARRAGGAGRRRAGCRAAAAAGRDPRSGPGARRRRPRRRRGDAAASARDDASSARIAAAALLLLAGLAAFGVSRVTQPDRPAADR